MADIKSAMEIAENPFLFLSAALLLQVAKNFIQSIRKGSTHENGTPGVNVHIKSIEDTLREFREISKETVTILGEIVAQNEDADKCEASIKRELERVHKLVADINHLLRDSSNPASNVAIIHKEEEVIRLLNKILYEIARLK